MNKKGFTLVEILAVVVILAIIMIIAVPNVMNSLNASKTALINIQKKAIEDAAKQVVTEVLNCELTDETYNVLNIDNSQTCSEVQESIINNTKPIELEALKTYKYYIDDTNYCSGNITITTDNNYKVTVDTSAVTCTK